MKKERSKKVLTVDGRRERIKKEKERKSYFYYDVCV
jgi:hypothetical protein